MQAAANPFDFSYQNEKFSSYGDISGPYGMEIK